MSPGATHSGATAPESHRLAAQLGPRSPSGTSGYLLFNWPDYTLSSGEIKGLFGEVKDIDLGTGTGVEFNGPRWRNGRRAAFRAQWASPMGVQISPSALALVAQRIERSPAEAEAVGSNPAKRAILGAVSSAVRAPALHAGSRRFKSPTAHHLTIRRISANTKP